MDPSGKVTYNGDSELRKVAVDEGSYRERGINGIDAFFYVADSASKGATLTFKDGDRITDQDGKEWVFDNVANTLTKTNWDGSTQTLAVTPPVAPATEYTTTVPNIDGTKFEARRNMFDMLDEAISSLRGLDSAGNPTLTYEDRRDGISKAIDESTKAYDTAVIAHSELGAKNKTFELVAERGEAQQDLTPLFADLWIDDPQKNDGVLDIDNMPLREEPECIISELNLYSKKQ